MLMKRVLNPEISPNGSQSSKPCTSGPKASNARSLLPPPSLLTSLKYSSKIPTPKGSSPLRAVDHTNVDTLDKRPGSPSPRTPPEVTRLRVTSRTQLRHASAARRLSMEGINKNVLPDSYGPNGSSGPVAEEGIFWSEATSTIKENLGKHDLQHNFSPVPQEKQQPLLRNTLNVAGVGAMADSTNMETLLCSKDFLKATFITPQSALDQIHKSDNYYHVWVAAKLAMEELPIKEHGFEKVLRLAFTKLLIELGSAIVDCLHPNIPHYTFVDPRRIMHPQGMTSIVEQALAVVEGLEKKGIQRDLINISIPATESGLAIAKVLREQHSIKTNVVFVSSLAQATATVTAGAASISIPFDSILTYHEMKLNCSYPELTPHPGRQRIKAVACYIGHHSPGTEIIATGIRSLGEIEHCSSLTNVCFSDKQVETAKWHRMRVKRPPGPNSTVMMHALQAPAPFPISPAKDNDMLRYFSEMTPDSRKEVAAILHSGLQAWQDGTARIIEVLRHEMQRQIDMFFPPAYSIKVSLSRKSSIEADIERCELMRAERSRSLMSRGDPRMDTLDVAFPTFESKLNLGDSDRSTNVVQKGRGQLLTVIPQSPFWQDSESFDEPGSSSDEDTDDMALF